MQSIHSPMWRGGLKSTASAAAQKARSRVPFVAGGGSGRAQTPLIVNRKIRRPARALQARRAGRIGQPAPHLVERGLGVWLAEGGIRGVRRRHSRGGKYRYEKRKPQRQPVRHVASPQSVLIPEGANVTGQARATSAARGPRATRGGPLPPAPPQLICGPGPPAASSTAARHSRFTGRIGGIGATSGSAVAGAMESMCSVREAFRMNML
jgi:hypothetical protein